MSHGGSNFKTQTTKLNKLSKVYLSKINQLWALLPIMIYFAGQVKKYLPVSLHGLARKSYSGWSNIPSGLPSESPFPWQCRQGAYNRSLQVCVRELNYFGPNVSCNLLQEVPRLCSFRSMPYSFYGLYSFLRTLGNIVHHSNILLPKSQCFRALLTASLCGYLGASTYDEYNHRTIWAVSNDTV